MSFWGSPSSSDGHAGLQNTAASQLANQNEAPVQRTSSPAGGFNGWPSQLSENTSQTDTTAMQNMTQLSVRGGRPAESRKRFRDHELDDDAENERRVSTWNPVAPTFEALWAALGRNDMDASLESDARYTQSMDDLFQNPPLVQHIEQEILSHYTSEDVDSYEMEISRLQHVGEGLSALAVTDFPEQNQYVSMQDGQDPDVIWYPAFEIEDFQDPSLPSPPVDASPLLPNPGTTPYLGGLNSPEGYPEHNLYVPLSPQFSHGWTISGEQTTLQPSPSARFSEGSAGTPMSPGEGVKSLLKDTPLDKEISKEDRENTPESMACELMEHQKIGLTWLKNMEEGHTRGSILADDMGLGKTIQTLALIVSHPSNNPACKTTLIVAPLALLDQWNNEAMKHLKPKHQLSIFKYHNNALKKITSFKDLTQYDIVLTTYGTITTEYKKLDGWVKQEAEARGAKPHLVLLGEESKFYRIVLDEAQYIKNKDAQCSKGCHCLIAKYRLCLSGTPLQNSFTELYPLLRFLRIGPYNDWTVFSKTFGKNQPVPGSMAKIRDLLKDILLRRTKATMVNGQPLITIPKKSENLVYVDFSPAEKSSYDQLETKSQSLFSKLLRQNAVSKNYSNVLVWLLRLRQACCHPHLLAEMEESQDSELAALKDLAKQLTSEVVDRVNRSDSLECPVCMEDTINPCIVIPCGHLFCQNCVLELKKNAEINNHEGAAVPLHCPSCRGELNTERLTSFKAFRKVYPLDDEVADDIVDGGDNSLARAYKHKTGDNRNPAELRRAAAKNDIGRREYINYLGSNWVDSGKVTACINILTDIREKDPSEKTIVFSQFTSLLDILEVPLGNVNIKYRRYDGSMAAFKRDQALIDFTTDDSIKVLLISLKAGNSGLNLNVASQVILCDPFYNPFVELQAIDRAHRLGQKRAVTVHRLIVRGTVEDRVLNLQAKKRQLIEAALGESNSAAATRFDDEDLQFLMGL